MKKKFKYDEKTCKNLIMGSVVAAALMALYIYYNYLKVLAVSSSVVSPGKTFLSGKYLILLILIYIITFIFTMNTVKSSGNKKLWKSYLVSVFMGIIGIRIILGVLTFLAPLLKEPVIYIPCIILVIMIVIRKDYYSRLSKRITHQYENQEKYDSSPDSNKADDDVIFDSSYSEKLKNFITVIDIYQGLGCKEWKYCKARKSKNTCFYVEKIIELGDFQEVFEKSSLYFATHSKDYQIERKFSSYLKNNDRQNRETNNFLQFWCQNKYGRQTVMVTDINAKKCYVLVLQVTNRFGKSYVSGEYAKLLKELNPKMENYVDFFGNKIAYLTQKNLLYPTTWDF